jgi:murein DD-endopeptidase MepM/ murein hydrolase activator NlpD
LKQFFIRCRSSEIQLRWRKAIGRSAQLGLVLLIALLWTSGVVSAQESQPAGPVYIVQAGDSLWDIAVRFGVSLDDLMQVNGISDPSQLAEGAQLIIPGLEGIQGVLTTVTIQLGDNLSSLSRRYHVPVDTLLRLNHLTSPAELFVGSSLILPEQNSAQGSAHRAALKPGQSLLELSVIENTNPWAWVTANSLPGTWAGLPGDVYQLPAAGTEAQDGQAGALPAAISAIELDPAILLQGKVAVIHVTAPDETSLTGTLMGHELHFFPNGDGTYVSLAGVHAMAEPGLYPLELAGTLPGGTPFNLIQSVWVKAVNYPFDRPLTVNPTTIDPAVTKPEEEQWFSLTQPATPQRYWEGTFQMPSSLPKDYCLESGDCWSSRFGNRRSYNGGPYTSFHTGLDIVGSIGTEIYAPAAGKVVFAGPLSVRGNATVIDHGWGVYTGYMHQSEIYVSPGDMVSAGQLIGLIGDTGRVEGPHLHWELFVGGVQVDPMDWLTQEYP